MTKLDWTKADNREADPARAQRDGRSFMPSDTASEDFKVKKSVRKQAAKAGAATRKRNREIEVEHARWLAGDTEREAVFFENLRKRFRESNEARRSKREAKDYKKAGGLGKLLLDALRSAKVK